MKEQFYRSDVAKQVFICEEQGGVAYPITSIQRSIARDIGDCTHVHRHADGGSVPCSGQLGKAVCHSSPKDDITPIPHDLDPVELPEYATHMHTKKVNGDPWHGCNGDLTLMQRWAEPTCPERGPVDCVDATGAVRSYCTLGTVMEHKGEGCSGGVCHVDGMGILPDPLRVHRCKGHDGSPKLVAALKLARKYVAKMAADKVQTVVPPSNAVRVIDNALAEVEPGAGHNSRHLLPVAVFYGDLDDESPDEAVQMAQGNNRRVYVVGLTAEAQKLLCERPGLEENANPLIAIENAIKDAAGLKRGDAKQKVWRAVDIGSGDYRLEGYLALDEDGAWRQMRPDIGGIDGAPDEGPRVLGLRIEEEVKCDDSACEVANPPGYCLEHTRKAIEAAVREFEEAGVEVSDMQAVVLASKVIEVLRDHGVIGEKEN